MPVYEYECLKCGARNEFLETLGGGRVLPRRCAKCGGVKMKRVVSGFVYNRPVTLEDLGVKVQYQPAAPSMPQPEFTGPPPGGCPYCTPEATTDAAAPVGPPQKPKSKK